MTDIRELIRRLIIDTAAEYKSHAYAAGYLGAMLADCLETMPEHQRNGFIRHLERSCKTSTHKTASNG